MEQTEKLKTLADKYQKEKKRLNQLLSEIEHKMEIIENAIKLVEMEEGKSFVPEPKPLDIGKAYRESLLYKGMTLKVAVTKILDEKAPEEGLLGSEIWKYLMDGGYESSSENFRRNLHIYLYRWENEGYLESTKSEKHKKYRLKRK
jgi:hypothetical protein